MAKNSIFGSENAVSEVVDVILILGIMLIAITVITVAGFPALQNMQESGHQENIRQSFIVLGENLNKVAFNFAPSQSVELKMYGGGGIWVNDDNYINVTVETWNASSSSKELQPAAGRQLRHLENTYEDMTISYENSGVWAKYQTGQTGHAVMVQEPQFIHTDEMLFIPVTAITGSDGMSGEGLIRVIAENEGAALNTYQNVSAVDIQITSSYYTAWAKYLNETLEMQIVDMDSTNSTVHANRTYTENIDVYVLRSPLSMRIE